jgi:hypothetical protein
MSAGHGGQILVDGLTAGRGVGKTRLALETEAQLVGSSRTVSG